MLVNAPLVHHLYLFLVLLGWWKTREAQEEMSASVHQCGRITGEKKSNRAFNITKNSWRMYLLGRKKFDAVFLEKYNGTHK